MSRYKMSTVLLGIGAGANLLYFGGQMYASLYGTDEDPSALKNNQAILSNMELMSVQVFFRHGARLPLKKLPGVEELTLDKDHLLRPVPHTQIPHQVINTETGGARPPKNIDNTYVTFKGGIKAGQLTSIGREQAYELGQKLRKLYMEERKLLQSVFSHKETHARSTNVNRTIESLESVLAGLYTHDGIAEKEQPTIHVLENRKDGRWETLYPNTHRCKALKELERDVPKAMAEDDYISSVVRRVNQIIGRRGKPVLDMTAFRDEIIFRQTHDLPIDRWVEEMAEEFYEVSPQLLHLLTVGSHRTTDQVLPLTVGRAYHDVITNFSDVAAGKDSGRKLVLYSCHDSMLVPLVAALGVFDGRWPPYCASLVLEMYRDTEGKHWVRTSYCDKVCALRDCDSQVIPYEKFKEVLKPYTMSDDEHREKCSQITAFSQTVKAVTKPVDVV